jgi:DNA-binding CsgD family transcriptional regulator
MTRSASFSDPKLASAFCARLTEACLTESFGHSLVEAFASLIPGCIVSLDQIHLPSSSYNLAHTLPTDDRVVNQAVGRLMQVFSQSPIHRYMDGSGPEKILTLRELATSSELEKTDFYQDVLKPLDIDHQIALRLDRPGWTCTVTLNRDIGFEPELKSFLEHISPALIASHRVACEIQHLRSSRHPATASSYFPSLTAREWEVFTWLREGKRNSEIALILQCAVRTVEKHVESILRKTGAETRTAATRLLKEPQPPST